MASSVASGTGTVVLGRVGACTQVAWNPFSNLQGQAYFDAGGTLLFTDDDLSELSGVSGRGGVCIKPKCAILLI